MNNKVILHKRVQKILKKLPQYIVKNLQEWTQAIETQGIEEIRKISGYHDEPLGGNRKGQRSVRLSKSYRAFYIEYQEKNEEILNIIEV